MKLNIHHKRLCGDVHRALTELVNELKDPRIGNSFITVTRVDMTVDLAYCKVFVSVLGNDEDIKKAVCALERASGHLRTELSRRVRLRKTPELRFIVDDGAAYAQRINDILSDLNEQTGV